MNKRNTLQALLSFIGDLPKTSEVSISGALSFAPSGCVDRADGDGRTTRASVRPSVRPPYGSSNVPRICFTIDYE